MREQRADKSPLWSRMVEISSFRATVSLDPPRWTAENRPLADGAKAAISAASETGEFYFVPSSVRKSVCTFVRQLRGPHLSTCA
jgi:hypothetical protein